MTNRFLAFDLEISALIPDDAMDWKQFRPLGITCAATAWISDNGNVETSEYHSEDDYYNPLPRMTRDDCRGLVQNLRRWVEYGYTLLTHNGVSFDFDILAEESGLHSECVELAMNSVDTCLLMHCLRGFPVGLDAICKGMGIQGKLEGMSGSLAPQMWLDGRYDEVLAYVAQDAKCTLEVALEIKKHRLLRWVSKQGYIKTQIMPRLLPVREALKLPEPDVSWQTNPIPRSRFTEWMTKSPG